MMTEYLVYPVDPLEVYLFLLFMPGSFYQLYLYAY